MEAAPPVARIWSLRRRLTVWIAIGVTLLVGSGVAFVVWFMSDSLSRELDALVEEELAELKASLVERPLDLGWFDATGRTLNARHPEFLVSIRAFRQGGRAPWAQAGSPWPIDSNRPHTDGSATPQGSRFGKMVVPVRFTEPGATAESPPETARFEILIDGFPRATHVRKVGAVFLIFALLGGVAATASGAFLSMRLSKLLREIAESAGAQRLDADTLVPVAEGAPEEIRGVVEAIRASVSQMREEHGRNVLLTAGLAHELRSPLQNAMAETEVTLLRERSADEYRTALGRNLDELREFALVVDNLITITAIRDTKGLGRRERFDFAEEALMRLTREQGDAQRKDVELRIREEGDTRIEGDREALILMLRNLVSNAVRWSPPGTAVDVCLDGRSSELCVSVEDSGVGVPDDEREVIFDAFRQGAAPEGLRTGYGLGLALARAAVTAHGGDICVAESSGSGARFEVRLPRDGAVVDPAVDPGEQPGANGRIAVT